MKENKTRGSAMSHILERFSFEEISIIHMCKQKRKQQLLDELNMMLLYSKEDMAELLRSLIDKIRGVPEEEIQTIINFPM